MKNKKLHVKRIGFLLLFLLGIVAMASVADTTCTTSGIVRFVDVEGGCWYIELENGDHIEPVSGVDDSFLVDSLKVTVGYTTDIEIATICMVGTPAIIHCIQAETNQASCKVNFRYERLRIDCDTLDGRCGDYTYQFKPVTHDSLVRWRWVFNVTDTVYDLNPVYDFGEEGIFSVCLEAEYESGCLASHCERIWVGDSACRANFKYEPMIYLLDSEIHDSVNDLAMFAPYPYPYENIYYFYDTSVGDVVSWKWEFGDDSVYYTQNVIHQFINGGWHKVCLTITTSDSCSSTICKEIYVEPVEYCHASFYYEQFGVWESGINLIEDSVVIDDPVIIDSLIYDTLFNDRVVQFYNTSSGNIDEVSWDFGDGNTSTEWSPRHEYADYGEYLVSLTVKSDSCEDVYETIVSINPLPGCNANFEYCNYNHPDSMVNDEFIGYLVGFKDMSSGRNIYSWTWSFGDGNYAYERNPFHRYMHPGEYTVCLQIHGSAGCYDEICKKVVVGNNCEIDFTWDVVFPDCMGFMPGYVFEVKSNLPLSYTFWDFGDGEYSYEQNPVHSFETYGEYQVCLTAQQQQGCRTQVCKYINQYQDDVDSMFFKKCGQTAIGNLQKFKDISLENMFPNPAFDNITFEINIEQSTEVRLMFYDLVGTQKINKNIELNGGVNEVSVNISELPAGNYIYKIVSGKDILHGKLIVK